MREVDVVRFWSKIERRADNECWPWRAGLFREGYGAFRVGDMTVIAHRVVWVLTHGPLVPGANVRMKCGMRSCCNPAHLYVTSHGRQRGAPRARDPIPEAA